MSARRFLSIEAIRKTKGSEDECEEIGNISLFVCAA